MELHGIYVPLITPFAEDGTVAEDALAGLAHSVLDEGAAGLAVLGTTGEPAALDAAERQRVLEICREVCRERGATLIVGAGNNDTRHTAAELAGVQADAALVRVPYFSRPGEAGVLAHFQHLAERSPVPLIAYHIPYRTAQSLSADTLRRIGELPNVAGVKLAAGAVDPEVVDLLGELPPGFAVLAGDDALLGPLLALGATGGILASAHVQTGRFVELVELWHKGDLEQARALGHRLARWARAAFAEPNPTVIKGVLHAQGRIPTADVRLPLLPAGAETVANALTAIA